MDFQKKLKLGVSSNFQFGVFSTPGQTVPQYAQKVKKWKKPHISRSKFVMNDHDPLLESIWGNYLEKIEKILSLWKFGGLGPNFDFFEFWA